MKDSTKNFITGMLSAFQLFPPEPSVIRWDSKSDEEAFAEDSDKIATDFKISPKQIDKTITQNNQ